MLLIKTTKNKQTNKQINKKPLHHKENAYYLVVYII